MTVKGGTTPACAACKYQRRKCSPNCPLAPYFPANQPKMFQSVHRLFGVSNVTKTLEKLHTRDEKDDAMRSIIYEADMRERFPVHGCCAVLAQLHRQLQVAHEEMQYVCTNLEVLRRDQMTINNNSNSHNNNINNNNNNNKVGSYVGLDSCLEFGSSLSNDAYPYGVGYEPEHLFLDENVNGDGFCIEKQLMTMDLCNDTMMRSNLSCDSFGISEKEWF